MKTIRLLPAALLVAALAPARGASLPPPEHFFNNPLFSNPVLSPSGRYLAARLARAGGRDTLGVMDLSTGKARIVAQFDEADVGRFQWVNDNRLLYNARDNDLGERDRDYAPGLFAVDRDGQRFRQLAHRAAFTRYKETMVRQKELLPWHTYMLDQQGAQDSDWVYVEDVKFDGPAGTRQISLLRLNTVNGRTEGVPKPGFTTSWLLDTRGQPRLAHTIDKNIATIHLRDGDKDEWRKLGSFDAYLGSTEAFDPLAFGADGTLYVNSNRAGNYSAVHTYDFAGTKINPKPLIQLGEYDFEGSLLLRDSKVVGVRYLRETSGTHWFDAGLQKVQEKVDALLPHTVNLIDVPARPESPYLLVKAYSDVQPPYYLTYNQDSGQLTRLADSYPAIRTEQMGIQQNVRYKARDGLMIPATLTLPRSGSGTAGGKHPLVVLVHGGPYMRGSQWGWDPEVQFLASRGYAVLQPEFRGSTGFGDRHFRAGWKQWGLKMQDDIADGAKWAVANGHADATRICIAGGSYGGYAALMGLVNDQDLYQCGLNWAGVTDIKLLYTGHWMFTSDMSERWKQYGMPELVGDQEKDAVQLKATSPLEQAARIKRPLLLAYGAADERVPLVHGTKFRDAVKATNKDVEWIEYLEEGHGWRLPQNRIDFWTRVEKFLNRHIGQKQE